MFNAKDFCTVGTFKLFENVEMMKVSKCFTCHARFTYSEHLHVILGFAVYLACYILGCYKEKVFSEANKYPDYGGPERYPPERT